MGFAAVAVVLGAAACDAGGDSERSESATSGRPASTVERVEVASSLEGMSTLPRHVHWVATTSLPAQEVKEVRFLAGPYRVWTDFEPPYTYGPEGYGPYRPLSITAREGRPACALKFESSRGMAGRRRKVTMARVPKLQVPRSVWFEPVVYGRLPPPLVRNPVEVEQTEELASRVTSWAYFSQGQVSVGRTSETAYTYEYAVEGMRLHVLALRSSTGPLISLGSGSEAGGPADPSARWTARPQPTHGLFGEGNTSKLMWTGADGSRTGSCFGQ